MKRWAILLLLILFAAPAGAATYSDSFSQANENPLSSSGVWDGGYTGFGNLKVVSNKVQASGLSSDERMTVNSISPANDQQVQVKVATWNTSAADLIAFHLLLRWAAPATATGCEAIVIRGGGGDSVSIQEIVNGVETEIGTSQSVTISTNDIFKATISGTTLTVYQNGIQRHQQNCTAASSGRVGLGAFLGSGASLSDMELDDFTGGDLSLPATASKGLRRVLWFE